MRKNNIARKSNGKKRRLTIGVDLGDRSSRYCILDEQGEVILEGSVPTTKKGLAQVFAGMRPERRLAGPDHEPELHSVGVRHSVLWATTVAMGEFQN